MGPYRHTDISLYLPVSGYEKYPGIAGVSPAVTPQGIVGTALPIDALETGIDLKATISGRTRVLLVAPVPAIPG